MHDEGVQIVENLANIRVPMIAAIEGRAYALELDQVPEHLLVIGGGYVGVELAQAMGRFGSRVTVIDRNRSEQTPDV